MNRTARETHATRGLLAHSEQRFTGRLSVGRAGLQVSAYLLDGELVAATCPHDDAQIVRVLALRGLIDADARADLEARVHQGGQVFGDVLELAAGPVLDGILRDRFIQNLAEFVSSALQPRAEPQRAVFVDNIQLGHDTRELVLATCDDYDAAMEVDPDLWVVRGDESPGRGPARTLLVSKLSARPRTIRSIIQEAPLEPLRARLVIGELIRTGVAEIATEHEQEAPRPVSVGRSTLPPLRPPGQARQAGQGMLAVAEVAESGLLPLDAHAPLNLPPSPRRRPPVSTPSVPTPPIPTPPPPGDASPERTVPRGSAAPTAAPSAAPSAEASSAPVRPEPEQSPAPPAVAARPPPPEAGPPALPFEARVTVIDDEEETDDLEEEPTVNVSRQTVGAPPPSDEEELFAFSDHDRRSRGEGAFSTEDHHRDVVDVGGISGVEALPVPGGQPTLRFAGPTIRDDEVVEKVRVANTVLREVVVAFDAAEGPGRGRAVLQLLVDGGPTKYSVLMRDIRVGESGELPPAMVLLNLRKRPEPEQRPLLHNSLVDIIERALSSAADELPDDHVDTVLEAVAGYRQRLGR